MQFVFLLMVIHVILSTGKANKKKKYCVAAFLDMQDNSKVECIVVDYSWLLWIYLKLPCDYHMHWGKYVK